MQASSESLCRRPRLAVMVIPVRGCQSLSDVERDGSVLAALLFPPAGVPRFLAIKGDCLKARKRKGVKEKDSDNFR
jgi:hypothetical protein